MIERKVTIQDIATDVGVSKTTISRYLNGNFSNMSRATRDRIDASITRLNYTPNNAARTLKAKKSHVIAVIANTLRYQMGAQTVSSILELCNQDGYTTALYCSDDMPEKEDAAIRSCISQQVEGAIIIPCRNDPVPYEQLMNAGIPVVLSSRRLVNWQGTNIYVNHEDLIGSMMKHLFTQGFEKVRLLMDFESFHKIWMRQIFEKNAQGYFNMQPEECASIVGRDPERVDAAVLHFLSEYDGKKKALFAMNTNTLQFTLEALKKHNIVVPDEIGVCGYDALGWSELVPAGISAIRQPMMRTGRIAAEKLLGILEGGRDRHEKIALDGEIFYRNSTCLRK